MSFYIREGDRWYNLNTNYIKVNQDWKPVKEVWCHNQGQWVKARSLPSVVFINTEPRAGVSVFELMGSPTEPGDYVFENLAEIIGNYNTAYSLRTGVFPEGSKLTIINRNVIRGRGGDGVGWTRGAATQPASPAIQLDYPTTLDNLGEIIAGGNGGSVLIVGNRTIGGGGGAGAPVGRYSGSMEYDYGGYVSGTNGTLTTGGSGARFTRFGYVGYSGANAGTGVAIKTNGHPLDHVAGNPPTQIKGSIT